MVPACYFNTSNSPWRNKAPKSLAKSSTTKLNYPTPNHDSRKILPKQTWVEKGDKIKTQNQVNQTLNNRLSSNHRTTDVIHANQEILLLLH